MLGHLALVELGGHAGKLQLAMQRLVGDAEQRGRRAPGSESRWPLWSPIPCRARWPRLWERRCTGPRCSRGGSSPRLRLFDGWRTVPVRMMRFSFVAGQARDLADRFLQRDLDLGQCGNGHPDRQVVVEDMILAHIGVRQNVIAQRLGVAQARAVAKHQPGMRAQHGDVVGNRRSHWRGRRRY